MSDEGRENANIHFEGLRLFADSYTCSVLGLDRSVASLQKVIRKADLVADKEINSIHERAEGLANAGEMLPIM